MSKVFSLPDGIAINIEQPYTEGHPLNALEAEKLNGLFAENIMTSLRAKLKRAKEEAANAETPFDASAIQTQFQEYANAYSFVTRAPRAATDPIQREAHKLAKEQIFGAIRHKGGNPADYSSEQISQLVATLLQRKPEITEEAHRRVESSRQIAGDMLADLLEGGDCEGQEQAAAAE